jgi:serpin B
MGDQEDSRPSKKPRASSPAELGSGGLTAFALRLSKKLAEGDNTGHKNVAFSPLSIYTTLGLVAAGARGKTLDEILALLGASSPDEVNEFVRGGLAADTTGSGGPLVTFAYGVFHQKRMELMPAYLHTAAESYKAEIRAVDFVEVRTAPSFFSSRREFGYCYRNFCVQGDREKIREEINGWVAVATSNLIPEILPEGSLLEQTRFVLANAIYFKGTWENRFPEGLTEDLEFHRLGGAAPVDVPFMTLGRGERKVFFSYDDGFKVLKLPYKATDDGARYSMCVFLPHERDGLRAMVDALAAAGGSLLDHVPKSRSSVREVLLPKFKLSFFCSLVEELKGLGLADAFTEDADLSCLVDQRVCDVRLDEGFMFFFRDLLVLTNFVLSSVLHVIVYIVIHPCELRVKL